MSARRGFTLWEMAIVLALVALTAALVIPNWVDFGENPVATPGQSFVALLRDARKVAIDQGQTVAVRVDPTTLFYRIDTTGTNGTGMLVEGSLDMGTSETLDTDLARLRYVFRPSGAALGDTVSVRGEYNVMIALDPWSGNPVAYAR